jgi:hypothetical protein
VPVVVLDVLLENRLELTVTVDQRRVETLVADGPHEAFGERGRSRRTNRCPDHPNALGAEDIIERWRERGIPVSDEEPGRADVPGHGEVAGLLGHPGTLRACGDAPTMHPAGTQLDEEQHLKSRRSHTVSTVKKSQANTP